MSHAARVRFTLVAVVVAIAMLGVATHTQQTQLPSLYRLVPGHPVVPDPLVTLRARHGLKMTCVPRFGESLPAVGAAQKRWLTRGARSNTKGAEKRRRP